MTTAWTIVPRTEGSARTAGVGEKRPPLGGGAGAARAAGPGGMDGTGATDGRGVVAGSWMLRSSRGMTGVGGAADISTTKTGGIARAAGPGRAIGVPRLNGSSIARAVCPGARKRQAECRT